MKPTFDTIGQGAAVVFLHAGIADRRMWHPQWQRFGKSNKLVRVDLFGFGANVPHDRPFSNRADVIAILDHLEIARAVFVGASMGARVALEIAVDYPNRVDGLVLIGPGVADHEWSQQVQSFWQLEASALDAGDLDGAVAANIEFWVDGPARDRADLSPSDRALVATMQRLAFEHEVAHPEAVAEDRMMDLGDRLGEIAAPTTVLYGAEDVSDILAIAERLAAAIPHATLHCIPGTAHLPSLEVPEIVNGHLGELLNP